MIRRAGFSSEIYSAQRVILRTGQVGPWLGHRLFILWGPCFNQSSGSIQSSWTSWIKLRFRDASIQDGPESLHASSGRWFLMPKAVAPKFSCRMKLAVSQIVETFVTFSLMEFMGPKFETFTYFRRSAMIKIVSNIEAATQNLCTNAQISLRLPYAHPLWSSTCLQSRIMIANHPDLEE